MDMSSRVKRFRQTLETLLARSLFAVLGRLSPDAASGFAGGVARKIGPLLRVSNVARQNLKAAFPDKRLDEIEAIVADVWENLGRVAGEFPHLDWLARNRIEIVGLETVEVLRDDGAPGLFVSAHFGNWELCAPATCLQGLPVSLVYRAANNPGVEALFQKARAIPGANGGQITKGGEGARAILEVLRRKGHVGMLVDQKMNDGISVPFFGREAMTAPAAARFALKFRCPVVMAKIERLQGAHFRATILPPLELPNSGDTHADVLTLMTAINLQLEDWVREAPGQWLWLHRRWPKKETPPPSLAPPLS